MTINEVNIAAAFATVASLGARNMDLPLWSFNLEGVCSLCFRESLG